ncbi:hypothetical protein QJH73_003906 [Escherichia coli]|nr:hypothetical protein [Escherichia coli]
MPRALAMVRSSAVGVRPFKPRDFIFTALFPLPSDRSFSGCLLPLAALFKFLFDCFHMAKKSGLMAANDVKKCSNGNVFVVDKNCG